MSTTPAEPEGPGKQETSKGLAEMGAPYRWKPGQSGNPKGRQPKEHTLTSLIKDELQRREPKSGETYETLLARAIVIGGVASAMKGHDALAKVILERTEGKVPDIIDLRALALLVSKPIEQMTLEELDAYEQELNVMIAKYAPMGLPRLLRQGDDTGSPGSPG